MKIIICKCTQCKASKRRKKTSVKQFFKRLTNKKLRKMKLGDVYHIDEIMGIMSKIPINIIDHHNQTTN